MFGILFLAGFLISIVLIVFLYRVRKADISKYLILGTILVSFWVVLEALSYYIRIEAAATLIFQKVKFFGMIFLPPLYLLAAWEYTKQSKQSRRQLALLFLIPGLSALSLLTNRIPYPFFVHTWITYADAVPFFGYRAGVGMIIHTLYSYAAIIYVCCCFLLRAMRSPKLYRGQSIFIVTGTVIALAFNIAVLTMIRTPMYIDYTSFGMLTVLAVLSWGIFRLPQSVMIPAARELLVENMEDVTFIVDSSDRIIDVNPAARRFISRFAGREDVPEGKAGYTGRRLGEVLKMIPDTRPKGLEETYRDGLLVVKKEEATYYFKEYHAPIYDKKGFIAGRLYMLRDETQAQEYVNRLKHLNEELLISDRIISSAVEGILITDSEGNILRVNEAFEKMSGYHRKELLGSNPRMFKSGLHDEQFYAEMWSSIIEKGYWEGEIWDRRKDGYLYPKWMSITSLKETEGSVEYYISISVDISNIKKAEEKLHKLAYYDSLTGIPNRTLFYEKLERAIQNAVANNNMTVLLFMDLDGFKIINDSLGHAVGDILLKEVAARIRSCIRKSDMVFRIGGDEFTIILEDIHDIDYVKNIAETIIHTIQLPYYIVGREMTLGVSIGIAIAPEDEAGLEGLVRRADAAMYDAKEAGKGRYSFSSEEIERRNHEILEMQIKLKKALAQNEFRLYLQPQIACSEGELVLVGAEALIRWITPDGIIFTPDKFIPVSENNGMIIPLGEWILEEILRVNRELKKQDISLKLAVNISSKQLEMDSFAETVGQIMLDGRAQGIDLEMEITERFLLKDIDRAISTLLAIKQQGIRIALDDFGTGFSSLSYLTRLPIDYLKIDKSFIDDIANPRYKSLAPHIISMAKSLNIKTIAEGVELKEQADRLLECGCDELQGYYFGRPMELENFISYARQFQSKSGADRFK